MKKKELEECIEALNLLLGAIGLLNKLEFNTQEIEGIFDETLKTFDKSHRK